jgi:hypothetical protein
MKLLILVAMLVSPNAWSLSTHDLWVPQTETLDSGRWRLDMRNLYTPDKRTGDLPGQYHVSSFGFSIGAYQKNWVGTEIGLDWQEPAAESAEEALTMHLRVRLKDWRKDGWSIALGTHTFGFKHEVSDYNIMYALLQNRLGQTWSSAVGLYSGSNKLLVNASGTPDSKGVFIGLWNDLPGGRLCIEWMSGQNRFGYGFFGLRSKLHEFVTGNIGYGIAGNREVYRDWLLFRINVLF